MRQHRVKKELEEEREGGEGERERMTRIIERTGSEPAPSTERLLSVSNVEMRWADWGSISNLKFFVVKQSFFTLCGYHNITKYLLSNQFPYFNNLFTLVMSPLVADRLK
jgi:hypothetical protein